MYKILNRFDPHSVFFKILICTLIITILPALMLFSYAQYQMKEALTEQTKILDTQFLQKTSFSVEQNFQQLQMDGQALADSQDSISFVFSKNVSDFSLLQQIGADLRQFPQAHTSVISTYIYSTNNSMVMTSDSRYYPIGQFYDTGWLDLFLSSDASIMWTDPRTVKESNEQEYTCISLILSVPSTSRKQSGCVIINLDVKRLDSFLFYNEAASDESTGIVVFDKDMSPLFGNDIGRAYYHLAQDDLIFAENTIQHQQVKINKKKYLFSTLHSDLYDWYFLSVTSMEPSDYLLIGSTIFVLLMVGAALLALTVSEHLYRPVRKLVNELTNQQNVLQHKPSAENNDHANEYDIIRSEYHMIRSKASTLEEEISNLQPLIQEHYFQDLFLRRTEPSLETLQSFQFEFGPFAVLAVYCILPNSAEIKTSDPTYLPAILARAKVDNILHEYEELHSVCTESGGMISALIEFKNLQSPVDGRFFLLKLSKAVHEALQNELKVDSAIGFSPICADVSQIPDAYTSALKTVRFKVYQGDDDVLHEDDELLMQYSPKMNKLLEEISSGDPDNAQAAADDLFSSVKQNVDTLSQYQIQQISIWVLNNIIEFMIQQKVKIEDVFGTKRNLFSEICQLDDLNSISQWMGKISAKCAEELNSAKQKQQNQKVARIQEYIDLHIKEDISLNDVSEWIGLSPAYVSRIFKETTGMNFVEYLNSCRVEEAKQLLVNTTLSIKEIGFRSGFNTIQTFTRTFKKFESCTPSQYREAQSSYSR